MKSEDQEFRIQPSAVPAEADTRQRILSAAADAFWKNGYKRATTRIIAKEAGVSEVTLFRCFESKENLLRAVVETYAAPGLASSIECKLTGDYRRDMQMMAELIMQVLLDNTDGVAFALSEASHFPELRPLFSRLPGQLWQMLARYLEKRMADGTVRKLHPEAAAQSFFGSIFAYCVSKKLYALEPNPEITDREAAEQIVDVFVKGTMAQ